MKTRARVGSFYLNLKESNCNFIYCFNGIRYFALQGEILFDKNLSDVGFNEEMIGEKDIIYSLGKNDLTVYLKEYNIIVYFDLFKNKKIITFGILPEYYFKLYDLKESDKFLTEFTSKALLKMSNEKNISDNKKMIKIKYLSDEIEHIKFIEGEKSDWIDLRSAEDINLKAGEFKLIPLGVAMELPEGYEVHVVPRSSTFKNFGIIQTNSMGIIDHSYCGDNDQWYMPAYALRDTHISTNDRICQFRIMNKQENVEFIIVDKLGNEDRGGIGSTGKQ